MPYLPDDERTATQRRCHGYKSRDTKNKKSKENRNALLSFSGIFTVMQDGIAIHTNKLINETSPYLLQHAHNPVQWYAWGEEALSKAKLEDKPILVSIGYSACHWCHVMERESFEDEATAEIMNRYFINIKIDREERPDLDHVYMDAVQAMTGSGGWPLNVFLTPDCKPFYGGTYFPPVAAYGRMSWKETLLSVETAFRTRRHEIEAQADNLTEHIAKSNSFGVQHDSEIGFTTEDTEVIALNFLKAGDKKWGGFGSAPKFPQTFCILYLLRYHHYTGNSECLQHALLSLDKMIMGGIYDQVGGGFSRYSTDSEWLVPHFEKMLYDNALLLSVMAEAFHATGKEVYKTAIDETITFLQREMKHSSGGYYCALDADSEGEEGKYYTWSRSEIDLLLGENASLFCDVYGISEAGNWEGKNIPWMKADIEAYSAANGMRHDDLRDTLLKCRSILLKAREGRVPPALDDKILLGWNALLVKSFCDCYLSTQSQEYLDFAIENIVFLEQNLRLQNGEWAHTWKSDEAKHPAFLDDCAFLCEAYLRLYEASLNIEFLEKAQELLLSIETMFSDKDTVFFLYTMEDQQDIIVRKKEIYDGATASGNSVMAGLLRKLGLYFDRSEWVERSETMTKSIASVVVKYPTSFANWCLNVLEAVEGIKEVTVMGRNALDILKEFNSYYVPGKIVMAAEEENEELPLLKGRKPVEDETLIYYCRDFACFEPVKDLSGLLLLLKKGNYTIRNNQLR